MNQFLQTVDTLQTYIDKKSCTNESISAGSVGWHIQHSLLVIQKITETILASDPLAYSWSFNLKRVYVFLKNGFPRGSAKAPNIVIPTSDSTSDELNESIIKTKFVLAKLQQAKANQYFIHPFFGKLNKKSSIRFFDIHTRHHLKIIQDIIA